MARGRRGNFDVDSQYGGMIYLTIILILIFSLGMGGDPATSTTFAGNSSDILPTLTDLNSSIKPAYYDNVPIGNYKFIFQELEFNFNSAASLFLGLFANAFFMAAVVIGKATGFLVNLTVGSQMIPQFLGGIVSELKPASGLMEFAITWLIPIVYGCWATFTALAQKKYSTALVGVLAALMIYATSQWMVGKTTEIASGVSKSSSVLANYFSGMGSSVDVKTAAGVDPSRLMADNIWISQIYAPWAILQFGSVGFEDFEKRYDDDGNLKLMIAPLGGEDIQGKNWATYVLRQGVPMTQDQTDTAQKVIYTDRGKEEVDSEDPLRDLFGMDDTWTNARHRADPGTAMTGSFVILIANLFMLIIVGISAVLVGFGDVGIVVLLFLSNFIFFMSLIPKYGVRVFKSYASLIISVFLLKFVFITIIGMQVGVLNSLYLNTLKGSTGTLGALTWAALLSIFVTVAFLIVVFVLWKMSQGNIGGIMSAVAKGDMQGLSKEVNEVTHNGYDRFKQGAIGAMPTSIASTLFPQETERVIARKLMESEKLMERAAETKNESKAASLRTQAEDKVASASKLTDKAKRKADDPSSYNKYRSLNQKALEMQDRFRVQAFESARDGYYASLEDKNMSPEKMAKVQEEYRSYLQDTAEGALADANDVSADSRTRRSSLDIYNKILGERLKMDWNAIENKTKDIDAWKQSEADFISRVENGELTKEEAARQFNAAYPEKSAQESDEMLNDFRKNLSSLKENADDKTLSFINGYEKQVDMMRKTKFDNELNSKATNERYGWLHEKLRDTDMFEDPAMYAHISSILNKDKINLLEQKTAGMPNEADKIAFWKSELLAESQKPEAIRDNTLIQALRSKVSDQYNSIKELPSKYSDTSAFSTFTETNDQMKDYIKSMDEYLNFVDPNSNDAPVIRGIKEDMETRLAIFDNIQKPWDDQLSILSGLQEKVQGTSALERIKERINDVTALKFTGNVEKVANILERSIDDRDEHDYQLISDLLDNMPTPNTDFGDIMGQIKDGSINTSKDFFSEMNKKMTQTMMDFPHTDDLMDAVNRQQLATEELLANSLNSVVGQNTHPTKEAEYRAFVGEIISMNKDKLSETNRNMLELVRQTTMGQGHTAAQGMLQGIRGQIVEEMANKTGDAIIPLTERRNLIDALVNKMEELNRDDYDFDEEA